MFRLGIAKTFIKDFILSLDVKDGSDGYPLNKVRIDSMEAGWEDAQTFSRDNSVSVIAYLKTIRDARSITYTFTKDSLSLYDLAINPADYRIKHYDYILGDYTLATSAFDLFKTKDFLLKIKKNYLQFKEPKNNTPILSEHIRENRFMIKNNALLVQLSTSKELIEIGKLIPPDRNGYDFMVFDQYFQTIYIDREENIYVLDLFGKGDLIGTASD